MTGSGLAYCIGGRSLLWGGWAPELTPNDLKNWPDDVSKFLTSPEGYERTASEIGANKPTGFIEETNLYNTLYDAFQKAWPNVPGVTSVGPAPLAVLGSPPTSGIFPFEKFSSVTFLIDALNEDSAKTERRLMLLPRTEVIGLNRDKEQRVTSLDLKVGRDAKTLHLAPTTTVVLANGTVEATRLALAHLGVGRKDKAGRLKLGNFMAHMLNSITVRIKRTALGLSAKPSQSENELAAFIARGEVDKRRFHYQIVAAALQDPKQTPWDLMMKIIPDIDQLDQLRSKHNPKYITIVFRGVAEMEGNRELDAPDTWMNWIGLEKEGDPRARAYANLNPSKKDNDLWNAMDKVAIDLAKQLAPKREDIQWDNKGWQDEPIDPNSTDSFHGGIGSSHHEGGTLFMGGETDKSITDTDGKFRNLSNVYVVGPAVFPTIGDANPSLTGLTLARRTGDAILAARGMPDQEPKLKTFQTIFDEVLKAAQKVAEDDKKKKDILEKTSDNWSWAVCAAAIVRYYGGKAEASKIATETKAPEIKEKVLKDIDKSTPYSIPKHPNLESVLEKWSKNPKDLSIAAEVFPNKGDHGTWFPEIERLKEEIDKDRPVVAWIEYEKENYSDFIIIYGYDVGNKDDESTLWIRDPLYPEAKKSTFLELKHPNWRATWINVHRR